ncbi:DUF2244 domain-containing protein [Stella sp.]|uniref:DUF2244 domain-containing protein n=1 Tax=Stella sp. TaxID=2912054 RepID=UPI0035B49561
MAAPASAEPVPLLDLELRPHRSLPPVGFTVLMAVLGVVGFATGVLFLAIGAWPVFGFLGLDVLGLYVAFRISYARARTTADRLRLAGDALTVDRMRPRRPVERWTFQPYWLRVVLDEGTGAGRPRLVLTSHGRRLEVGAFLGPDERARVAGLLRDALRRYREPADLSPSTSVMS